MRVFVVGSYNSKTERVRKFKFRAQFVHGKCNSVFEPLFGGLRGNVRTPYIARWKARCRFPIGGNMNFFAVS